MKTYSGANTKEISFPLGGIGTGSIGLGGNGRLKDWEIFNRPSKGSSNGYSHIAVKVSKSGTMVDARVLNGDLNDTSLVGQYSKERFCGYGFGPGGGTMAGFPHFKSCTFQGEFPLARLTFADPHFPGQVTLDAFNPLIPLNDKDSSIPAAFFEITCHNPTQETLEYTVCFTVKNPFDQSVNRTVASNGILMEQTQFQPDEIGFGQLCLMTDAPNIAAQPYWYRGRWQDAIETFWRNFTECEVLPRRQYDQPGRQDHCSLAVVLSVPAGERKSCRFVLSWNIPNNYNYWNPEQIDGKDVSWKNYYAILFPDAVSSASYSLKEYTRLFEQTKAFHDALFSSTLPPQVLDAASANLSTLKGPTVLRLPDGTFYGWEGAHELVGSCEGTCTHVWNYAYALPFLFPALERSIRDSDFKYNRDENGRMQFRMNLPLGREPFTRRACVDGQMGGIIKTYREWKLCGDDEWLKQNWEGVKQSLEYAWSDQNEDAWDRNHDGILEGRQHHTLDMELFGPSSWLQGFYLAALAAAAEMAEYLGDPAASEYRALFRQGKAWSDQHLFNGSYYIQKIDLADKSILERFGEEAVASYWNEEAKEIKYQIGEGCEIDQLLAQWHANLCGLGDIFDPAQRKQALHALYQNNYKPSVREFYNPWRLFCLNDEAGTVICDYPQGAKKPALPVPYCQETMHGFEYALAGLMISEGMIEEGLNIVSAVRDRYQGNNRNPWNEIECGSNYARSMASWALLPIFSGFRFDMVKKEIGFAPVLPGDFQCLWSVDSAWGTVSINSEGAELNLLGGRLTLNSLSLPFDQGEVTADGKSASFPVTFQHTLTVKRR